MKAQLSSADPYGHSQNTQMATIILDPQLSVRLEALDISAPLYAGHYRLPNIEGQKPGDLKKYLSPLKLCEPPTKFGQWQLLPFTPHRRVVDGYLVYTSQNHGPGIGIGPEDALSRFNRGHLYLDGPTLQVLRALHQCKLAGKSERRRALQRAFGTQPTVHPVGPGLDLIPLRTPTIPPASHTNCYILGEKNLIVVDPASPYPEEQTRLLDYLQKRMKRGCKVHGIFLTHHHPDHVGGARKLQEKLGCKIFAHSITKTLLAPRLRVDETLEGGQYFEIPGEDEAKLRVLFTPGHAPGHLCLFNESSGALIAGDMVAGWGSIIVEYTEGDMSLYLQNLQRLKALEPSIVLPSHGPPTVGDVGLISRFINHRLAREAQIIDALSANALHPAALTDIIYSGVPAILRQAAEASLIAHLLKLEGDEAIAFDVSGRIVLKYSSSDRLGFEGP